MLSSVPFKYIIWVDSSKLGKSNEKEAGSFYLKGWVLGKIEIILWVQIIKIQLMVYVGSAFFSLTLWHYTKH